MFCVVFLACPPNSRSRSRSDLWQSSVNFLDIVIVKDTLALKSVVEEVNKLQTGLPVEGLRRT